MKDVVKSFPLRGEWKETKSREASSSSYTKTLSISLDGYAWIDLANSAMSRFAPHTYGACKLHNLSPTECVIKIAIALDEIYQYVDFLDCSELIYTEPRTNLLRDVREALRA